MHMAEMAARYWFEAACTGIVAVMTYTFRRLVRRVKREIDDQEGMRQVLLALMHDRLYQECKRILRKGSITPKELDNLIHLYTPYKVYLHGNGLCEHLYQLCRALPLARDPWDEEASEHDHR